MAKHTFTMEDGATIETDLKVGRVHCKERNQSDFILCTAEDVRPELCLPMSFGKCMCCGEKKRGDIYDCNGFVLCGDCRYLKRHNKPPPRTPHVAASATADPGDD